MILADKIIEERKKNGWSQEELAEQLDVSRQSISKWEGAQAIPDIQKIIKMAEVFGVSTDYLLKDELGPEAAHTELVSSTEVNPGSALRKVSMEEANAYLNTAEKMSPQIALGVSLCILSPITLIVLSGLSEIPGFRLSENAAAAIGIVVLLLMIAAAVFLFITGGSKLSPYEYLEKQNIDTEYGVTGMVTEKKKAYEATHTAYVSIGVILCILSAVPLLIAALLEVPDHVITDMVGVLLAIIAIAVNLLIRAGSIWESYQKLLEEGDYSVSEKRVRSVMDRIATVYWLLIVAVYLGWSLLTSRWNMTWIVWPVAGVSYAVVAAVARMVATSRISDPDRER